MNLQTSSALMATLWAGLILGISFVAQPAKFGAAGLSRATALTVGRRTFRAMHWVELGIGFGVLAVALYGDRRHLYLLAVSIAILFVQVLVLMPRLSKRVDAVLAGKALQKNPDHMVFALLELMKVGVLVLYALLFAMA
jgi:hypothetical protein